MVRLPTLTKPEMARLVEIGRGDRTWPHASPATTDKLCAKGLVKLWLSGSFPCCAVLTDAGRAVLAGIPLEEPAP